MTVHGLKHTEEIKPTRIRRSGNDLIQVLVENKRNLGIFYFAMLGMALIIEEVFYYLNINLDGIDLSPYSHSLFFLSLLLFCFCKDRKTEILIDPEKKAVTYLGVDESDKPIFMSAKTACEHIYVNAGTGGGKTRMLLSVAAQDMAQGSGLIYVDGKAATETFELFYAFARATGRMEDVLVLNFLKAPNECIPQSLVEKEMLKRSCTVDIMSGGSDDELKELFISLFRDAGKGNDIWTGRATTFLSGILKVLVWKRDNFSSYQLTFKELQNHLELSKIRSLIEESQNGNIPSEVIQGLKIYYNSLPQDDEVKMSEQHSYSLYSLIEGLSLIGNTYRDLFDVPAGAIDFKDVFTHKRLLFVMLPTLEKSVDSSQILGKLILTAVKRAISTALGSQIQGHSSDIFLEKSNDEQLNFRLILDEFKYMRTEGYGALLAQVRSLGVATAISAQCFGGLTEDGFKGEAAEIIANTSTKIFMKIEPDKETEEMILSRGGSGLVSSVMGFSPTVTDSLRAESRSAIDKIGRINIRDLTKQKPGEAHITFKDSILRAKMVFFDPTLHKDSGDPRGLRFLNLTLPIIINPRDEDRLIFITDDKLQKINDCFERPRRPNSNPELTTDVFNILEDLSTFKSKNEFNFKIFRKKLKLISDNWGRNG